MNSLLRRGLGLAIVIVAVACEPPSASSPVNASLAEEALVIVGTADEEQTWDASLEIAAAPPADYFLFVSFDAPTSLAGLEGFNPEACSGECSVAGLGDYVGRSKLDVTGRVVLTYRGSHASSNYGRSRYFVLARRRAAEVSPLTVTGRVGIEGNGGCGGDNPDPPAVRTEALTRP